MIFSEGKNCSLYLGAHCNLTHYKRDPVYFDLLDLTNRRDSARYSQLRKTHCKEIFQWEAYRPHPTFPVPALVNWVWDEGEFPLPVSHREEFPDSKWAGVPSTTSREGDILSFWDGGSSSFFDGGPIYGQTNKTKTLPFP